MCYSRPSRAEKKTLRGEKSSERDVTEFCVRLDNRGKLVAVENETYQDEGQERKCGRPDTRIDRKQHEAL